MKIRSLLVGLVGCSGVCLSIMGFSKTEPLPIKKYAIEQFLNTKKYVGGAFSFDEKKIIFSSDESEVFNVYSMPVCGGNQTQLTNSTNHQQFPLEKPELTVF